MDLSSSVDELAYLNCGLCGKINQVHSLTEEVFLSHIQFGCGQRYCKPCVKREYYRKSSFPCVKCGVSVTEDKLTSRTLEEIECEKDYHNRKKISAIFNFNSKNFPNSADFRDYEELREEIIYNLSNNIKVQETMARLEEYKNKNSKEIILNKIKKEEKLKSTSEKILQDEEEKKIKELEFNKLIMEEMRQKKDKAKLENQLLLGDLSSSTTASSISLSMPNPSMLFISQRPDPRVVPLKNRPAPDLSQPETTRRIHKAGGYSFTNSSMRSWSEITSQINFLGQG